MDSGFWLRLGNAVIIGALAGLAALTFTQIVRFGTNLIRADESYHGWTGGEW